jgi:hypothetical protein
MIHSQRLFRGLRQSWSHDPIRVVIESGILTGENRGNGEAFALLPPFPPVQKGIGHSPTLLHKRLKRLTASSLINFNVEKLTNVDQLGLAAGRGFVKIWDSTLPVVARG